MTDAKSFGHDRIVGVQPRHLVMLAPFCSTDESRYYLHGIYVEPADEGVIMVATDGHCMGIIHDPDASANAPWICRTDAQLLELADKGDDLTVFSGEHLHIIGRMDRDRGLDPADIWNVSRASRRCPPINGQYPNWRKIVPTDFAGDAINPMLINIRKMQQLDAAARAGGSQFDAIRFHISGQFAPLVARVTGAPEFIGLIMPMKPECRDSDPIPEWLHIALSTAQREAAQ